MTPDLTDYRLREYDTNPDIRKPNHRTCHIRSDADGAGKRGVASAG